MNKDKEFKERLELDINNCINCKKCFKNCPMMKKFGDSPKEIMIGLMANKINEADIAYSCMLCDLCTKKCPKNIDLKSTFYELRKQVKQNSNKSLKDKNYNVVRFHQRNSFSPIFSKSSSLKNSKAMFLPGCSLSSYDKNIVSKSYEYLKQYYKDISITFNCCGKPTLAMGDINRFEKYYSKLDEMIEKNNIEEIIVACPNCYNTIGKHSKNIKITSIYEVISENGIPRDLENHYKSIDIAVHDSCSVRRQSNIHDSIRNILNSLGVNIIEFKNNRENTVCCGAGGMVGVTNRSLALEQMKNRGNETSCNNIVCYCESCCESLLNSNKNVLHILDLLFNENVIDKNVFTQNKVSTINKWKMRYKTVGIVKK